MPIDPSETSYANGYADHPVVNPRTGATRVEFFANGQNIATVINEPFTLMWSNVVPGSHTLPARATDHLGLVATSAPVMITVATPPITLIPKGTTWRYLDTGANLGTAWRGTGFLDTNWPAGPARAIVS